MRLILAILLLTVYCMAKDFDLLFAKLMETYTSTDSWDASLELLQSQNPDGTWPNFEYHKKGNSPIGHLKNVRTLAEAYRNSCLKEGISEKFCSGLKKSIDAALGYWASHKENFISDNWWMNEIGIQRELSPIAFLVWDEISEHVKFQMIAQFPEIPTRNGANRTWISELVVVRGILEKRDSLVKLGVENIKATMQITNQEGFQDDFSYLMHGRLLYNGGYGRNALSTAAKWAYLTQGTEYEFDKNTIENMRHFALQGNRWMMWNGMIDVMSLGREISRSGSGNNVSSFLGIPEYLKKVDSLYSDEYVEWLSQMKKEVPEKLSGCHYFLQGEFLVCRSPEYYISLKLSSRNSVASESINRENRKGFWLGMGVLSVYRHANDFEDIYPLWDWRMLPGVTGYGVCEQKMKRVTNENDFVTGVADNQNAVAAMILQRPGIYAKKSWVVLGNRIVAFGSGIRSSLDSEVKTTIDQRLTRSDVVLDENRVWHDSIGYATLNGKSIRVENEEKYGNWRNIGTEKISRQAKVLKIWLEHGMHPNAASYAYLTEVGVPQAAFMESKYDDLKIVRNDLSAQVVYDAKSGLYGGVVYEPGLLSADSVRFFFEKPCVFLMDAKGNLVRKQNVALKN